MQALTEQTKTSALLKVLVVDDDPQAADLVQDVLEVDGVSVIKATSASEGRRLFRQNRPRVVLVDMYMPDGNGIDVIEEMAEFDSGAEIVLMTGQFSSELAVEAVRKGAADCLPKPLDIAALRTRIREFIEQARNRAEALRLDTELLQKFQVEGIVGRSPEMLELFAKLRRIASHYRTVLVTGPTGTGKELIATAIHKLSPVSGKMLAVCNCAALVETLIESELFGYVRGAFTGAAQDKPGLFEHANGGTVFLDEIGDMPLAAQAKLLRVLQNHEVQRVGSPVTRKVDVRIVAATHRDLAQRVKEGLFREDLYYRLAMVHVKVPPLSERVEDLPLLQRYFVAKFAKQYGKEISGITRRAQAVLNHYPWPGNIRELENAIGHGCMMTDSSVVDRKDLPEYLATFSRQNDTPDAGFSTMEEMQERYLLQVLDSVKGDKSSAARILGLSRATVYSMLAKIEAKRKAPTVSKD